MENLAQNSKEREWLILVWFDDIGRFYEFPYLNFCITSARVLYQHWSRVEMPKMEFFIKRRH